MIDLRGDARAYDVAVVGLGHVGLPTAMALRSGPRTVLGLDPDPDRLQAIRSGRVDLAEGDRARLAEALACGGLALGDDAAALRRCRTVIVCAPTPVDERLLPDLEPLRRACAAVVAAAVPGQLIILSSTCYPGSTAELLVRPLAARGLEAGVDIHVCFSPLRIDPPGSEGLPRPDVTRVVGGVTPACTRAAIRLLGEHWQRLHPVSSPEVAEMSPLLETTFRAVNIAFANEVADICRTAGIDVTEVIDAAATKPYGFMPFFPGPGVGGPSAPSDPQYLLWQTRRHRLRTPVIEQALAGLSQRPAHVVERVRELLSARGRGLSDVRVLVVGVTYKPDVRDVRESPALEIIERLRAAGAVVGYVDPLVPVLRLQSGQLVTLAVPEKFDADLVLVHTAHGSVDLSWLQDHPLVLDTTYRLTSLPGRTLL